MFRGRLTWVRAVPDPALDECRIAYALGRRIGSAVVRNRIRRRLRAIVQHHSTIVPSGLMLIGATPAAADASFAALEADLVALVEDVASIAVPAPAQAGA